MRTKLRSATPLVAVPRPLISPGAREPKSGCLWCPLLPWSADFVGGTIPFCRDAEKILAKEPDGHVVNSRAVSEAWTPVDVLFIGDVPDADDDREGMSFVGRSGTLLRGAIDACNQDTKFSVGVSNTVRCRPPRNRDPNKTEIQSCTPELIREIRARKPRLLVALGNVPLNFLTGRTGITTMAGKLLDATHPDLEGYKVFACFHPAYVLRFDHEMDRFIALINEAWNYLNGEYVEKTGTGECYVLEDVDDLRVMFESFASHDNPIAFDTETGALNWWQTAHPRLLCLSFSEAEGVSYVVPYDHVDSPWRVGGSKEHERDTVSSLLRGFFESGHTTVTQNGQFDAKHINAALGVMPRPTFDTMNMHLTIDERRGTHRLDVLAFEYTGMGGYDTPLERFKKTNIAADPDKGGSYANIPGDVLFPYAGYDADVTLRVHRALQETPEYAKNKKLQNLAEVFFPALSATLAEIEWNGAQIDPGIVAELDEKYTAEMAKAAADIQAVEVVKQFVLDKGLDAFNPASPKQLGTVLFDKKYSGADPVHLTNGGVQRLRLRYGNLVEGWRKTHRGPKPRFTDVYKDALASGEIQHFSTDAEALQELDLAGVELASKIVAYRSVATLHGTFVKPLQTQLDEFFRIHGEFALFGTVTGRLASYNPNLQNIPNKGDGKIKWAYVSRFGAEGVICQADYSQIELRIAASIFNEPTMLKLYREGADVHTATALDISKLTKTLYDALPSAERKQWRTRAKRVNFGVLYQGGPKALVKTLKKDGVFITIEEAEALIERFYEVRPALRRGIEKLEKGVLACGYLESFTGRRRRVPEVASVDEALVARALRQSVNFPVQSGASDMTLMSLVLIAREMKKRGLRSLIILTVHDSIVFDCHVDEFAEVMQLAKTIMENLPKLSDEVLPDLDWSWLKCPIVVDCEVGTRWGTTVEFDPFDYDVDELWTKMAEKEAA